VFKTKAGSSLKAILMSILKVYRPLLDSP